MAREVICGIYKITNLVNGKIYIGQSQDIYRRWTQHKKIGKSKRGYNNYRNQPLYRALRKYGIHNFSFEIIEICNQAMVSEREIYWIDYYDCTIYNNKGYNLTHGGESNKGETQKVPVYQYDLEGNFIKRYDSIIEATVAIGANKDKGLVQNALQRTKNGGMAGGYQWRYEFYEKIPPYKIYYKHYKVACYNNQGYLEATFDSVKEAAEYFNCDKSAIGYCCQKVSKFCKNKIFRYYTDTPLKTVEVPVLKRAGGKGKPVVQIKDGEIINIFNSAQEAAQALNDGIPNPNGANYIGKICRKIPKFKSYKGYTWEFLNK